MTISPILAAPSITSGVEKPSVTREHICSSSVEVGPLAVRKEDQPKIPGTKANAASRKNFMGGWSTYIFCCTYRGKIFLGCEEWPVH